MAGDEEEKARLAAQALGPAAKAFGKEIEPLGQEAGEIAVRIARALLRPVGGLIWGYEQVEGWITEAVAPKVAMIPEEHRIEPKLMIAGPTIDAMKYAGSEPELRELFANLLASSMDARTAATAHPSFVEIIKQLAPDEARILKYLSERLFDAQPVVDLRERHGAGFTTLVGNYSHIGRAAGVQHDELTPVSLENLCRLGLCEMPRQFEISPKTIYDALESDPALLKIQSERATEGAKTELFHRMFYVTELGRQFIRVCVVGR